MKFGKLTIDNFMAIGHAEIALDERGLCVIQGINEDDSSAESNGAGKSSIPDALCWVWFGETARGESGDGVVNRFAGKNCRVESIIHDGTRSYKAVRHRKHKPHKNAFHLFEDDGAGGWKDITCGTDKLTQELAQKVIGSSLTVFRGAIYAAQEGMPDIPGMTDKQLKLLVEEAAGITILEQAYEKARAILNEVTAKVERKEMELEKLTEALDKDHWLISTVTEQIREFEDKRNAHLAELADSFSKVVKTIKDEEAMAEAIDEKEIKDKLARIDARIDGVKAELEKEAEIARELSRAEADASRMAGMIASMEVELKRLKAAYESTQSLVGTPCGECGKTYCEHDIEEARTIAHEKLREKAAQYKREKQRLDDARKRVESITERLEKHRESMTDLTATHAAQRSLRARLEEWERHRIRKETLERKAYELNEKIKEVKTAANPHEATLEKAKLKMEETEGRIDAVKAELDALGAEKELASTVAKIFSPAGVRAHILDDVTPFLNDQTAKYLGTLSDGNLTATWTTLVKTAKGELREKFSIEIASTSAGETFKSISGGEKRKVRIATALALQDLVARRATKPIDLFIGDEIDDALDDAGLERLIAILEEKASERGTVLIISHNALSEWVSNQIHVIKKDGRATISEGTH